MISEVCLLASKSCPNCRVIANLLKEKEVIFEKLLVDVEDDGRVREIITEVILAGGNMMSLPNLTFKKDGKRQFIERYEDIISFLEKGEFNGIDKQSTRGVDERVD
jgi:glutaredoxin